MRLLSRPHETSRARDEVKLTRSSHGVDPLKANYSE